MSQNFSKPSASISFIRLACWLMDAGRRQVCALWLRWGRYLGADRPSALTPIAGQRRGQLVARRPRPVVRAPGWAFGVFPDVTRRVFQALEKLLPLGVD